MAEALNEPLEFQFTLPRGERHAAGLYVFSLVAFQFTLPRGERPSVTGKTIYLPQFQFTLPRGERRSSRHSVSWLSGFNSRSREGSDQIRYELPNLARIIWFQFTLPRGERLALCIYAGR